MNNEIIDKNLEATTPEEETAKMEQETVVTIDSDIEATTPEEETALMDQETVETIDSDFEPRQVGEENTKQSQLTQRIFENLILAANHMKPVLETCLKKAVDLDEYLDFLKSENPESWIYTKFIEAHEITFNNLKPEKIIELRLLDIEGVSEVLAAFETFKSALKRVQDNGFYLSIE
jgi:hypothetical protein